MVNENNLEAIICSEATRQVDCRREGEGKSFSLLKGKTFLMEMKTFNKEKQCCVVA